MKKYQKQSSNVTIPMPQHHDQWTKHSYMPVEITALRQFYHQGHGARYIVLGSRFHITNEEQNNTKSPYIIYCNLSFHLQSKTNGNGGNNDAMMHLGRNLALSSRFGQRKLLIVASNDYLTIRCPKHVTDIHHVVSEAVI